MRLVAVLAGLLIGAVVLFLVVLLAGLRWQLSPVLDFLRRMNKSVSNPRVMRTAGTTQNETAVVEHVGRRSGRRYQTPVDVIDTPSGLLIALPYGTRADWVRNILAAGSSTVAANGERIAVRRPTLVPTDAVAAMIPKRTARMLRLFGVSQFLHLERS